MDIRTIHRPTIIQVTAPWCTHCRAMSPDVTHLADAYAGRVDLVTIDVSAAPTAAAHLGVRATPTLIGVVQGTEVFTETGRRTHEQLAAMFESLETGRSLSHGWNGDSGLAIGAGSILSVAGAAMGPAWGLASIGMIVLGFGLMRALRARDAWHEE